MTVFAFQFVCFIQSERFLISGDLGMTTGTGNFCMLSIKFERGFIVVEGDDLPCF